MTTTEQTAATDRTAIATAIVSAISAEGGWTASVWSEGGHVRVYVRRRGADQGYYAVDGDGDILIGNATNRSYAAMRAIEQAATSLGVGVYQ